MEWRPAGWSVCLPLLISPCTMKSRSSLLAPAHPGGPGKRAVKWLWWWWLRQLWFVKCRIGQCQPKFLYAWCNSWQAINSIDNPMLFNHFSTCCQHQRHCKPAYSKCQSPWQTTNCYVLIGWVVGFNNTGYTLACKVKIINLALINTQISELNMYALLHLVFVEICH